MSANLWRQANRAFFASGVWKTLRENGRRIYKYPNDLWIYEELIRRTQPDWIVETGSAEGGSALWFSRFANVISIDVRPPKTAQPWVTWLEGDSVARVDKVASLTEGSRVLVILDSDHNAAHVLRELDAYAPLATDYLIVEDTAVDVYGIDREHYPGGGPGKALKNWLPEHPEWEPDPECDRFLLGMNPGGWLRRAG